MVNWADDTPQLRSNLAKVFGRVRDEALRREPLTIEVARGWQLEIMQGLIPPDPQPPDFDRKLRLAIAELDALIEPGQELTGDLLEAVLTLCAWTHSEWIRIHPFTNGNGRTARLWVNSFAMRYGLPPFLRLRPRPGDAYGPACAAAMQGDWRSTVVLFRRMYINSLLI